MRVLVTGDRDWGNPEVYGEKQAARQRLSLLRALEQLYRAARDTIIVHGDARGADKLAGLIWTELAGSNQVEAHPANWAKYHRAAGPIRNAEMLVISAERALKDGHKLRKAIACHPDLTKSKGTMDMVKRLRKVIGDDNILYLT